MKKLSVLVLEDEMFKYHQLKNALEECCIPTVTWAGTVEEGLRLVQEAAGKGKGFDLIITDMNYPIREAEGTNPEAGMVCIEKIRSLGMNTPVVVCSSIRYDVKQAFACIWYSEARSLLLDLREVIMRI